MWGKSPTTGGSAETETSSSTHTQMSVMMTIGIYKNEERGKASSVATALSHLDVSCDFHVRFERNMIL